MSVLSSETDAMNFPDFGAIAREDTSLVCPRKVARCVDRETESIRARTIYLSFPAVAMRGPKESMQMVMSAW